MASYLWTGASIPPWEKTNMDSDATYGKPTLHTRYIYSSTTTLFGQRCVVPSKKLPTVFGMFPDAGVSTI